MSLHLDPNYTLDMNGMAWTPFALDVGIEMFLRERQLAVIGLPGDDRIHCFFCENALREWSDEMLSSVTI